MNCRTCYRGSANSPRPSREPKECHGKRYRVVCQVVLQIPNESVRRLVRMEHHEHDLPHHQVGTLPHLTQLSILLLGSRRTCMPAERCCPLVLGDHHIVRRTKQCLGLDRVYAGKDPLHCNGRFPGPIQSHLEGGHRPLWLLRTISLRYRLRGSIATYCS